MWNKLALDPKRTDFGLALDFGLCRAGSEQTALQRSAVEARTGAAPQEGNHPGRALMHMVPSRRHVIAIDLEQRPAVRGRACGRRRTLLAHAG